MITTDLREGPDSSLFSLCESTSFLYTFPDYYFKQTNFTVFDAWELHKFRYLV